MNRLPAIQQAIARSVRPSRSKPEHPAYSYAGEKQATFTIHEVLSDFAMLVAVDGLPGQYVMALNCSFKIALGKYCVRKLVQSERDLHGVVVHVTRKPWGAFDYSFRSNE